MTTTMTITLLIIAAASIALNVFQFMERRAEKKEFVGYIKQGALLERDLDKMTKLYDNERNHRAWAVGRIQDQQAVIDQLKKGVSPKKISRRKEADNVR